MAIPKIEQVPGSNQDASGNRTKNCRGFGNRWYYYAHAEVNAFGEKVGFTDYKKPIKNSRSRTHIFTALPARDGSQLVYGIPFDLDYEEADSRWKTRGKLDWRKMKSFIDENYPTLGRYLCTWTRSTRGRGLGVILFCDPFIRHHEKTGGVNRVAKNVQRLACLVLNFHGMGCDSNATGIARWTPNWRNGRILLYKDEVTIRRVQRENERHNVLRQSYNELRRSKAFKCEVRANQVSNGVRFAVKETANRGLAEIYRHIIDSEPETLCIDTSYSELALLSGLSVPTVRKALKTAPWASFKKIWGSGIQLTVIPSSELSALVFEGKSIHLKPAPCNLKSSPEDWELPSPESVGDSERNNYIWRRAVILRNEGKSISVAIETIRDEISDIPDNLFSRNCRNFERITTSIFNNDRRGQHVKRKIFSLEARRYDSSISALPRCPDSGDSSSVLVPFPKKENENVFPIQGVLGGIPLAAEDKAFDNSQLVNEDGGAREAIPTKISDQDKAAQILVMAGLDPNIASRSRKSTPIFGAEAPEDPSKTSSEQDSTAKYRTTRYKNMKDYNRSKYDSMNPLNRFEIAYNRCLNRKSEKEIIDVLRREAPKMLSMKNRYRPLSGPYKRVLAAFKLLPAHLMQYLLSD